MLDQISSNSNLLFLKFCMKIRDTGEGIKEEDLDKLF